jgi:predicted nucleotidyltransferase
VTDFAGLLRGLAASGVEFILVGGAAATAHGSVRLTLDVDVVYQRSPENIARLVAALTPWHPYLRGAPPGLPFRWDAATVVSGLNFTLTTDLGDLDLLGEITGGGGYNDLLGDTIEIDVFGVRCRCLGLTRLIAVKRAAGRPKDLGSHRRARSDRGRTAARERLKTAWDRRAGRAVASVGAEHDRAHRHVVPLAALVAAASLACRWCTSRARAGPPEDLDTLLRRLREAGLTRSPRREPR